MAQVEPDRRIQVAEEPASLDGIVGRSSVDYLLRMRISSSSS